MVYLSWIYRFLILTCVLIFKPVIAIGGLTSGLLNPLLSGSVPTSTDTCCDESGNTDENVCDSLIPVNLLLANVVTLELPSLDLSNAASSNAPVSLCDVAQFFNSHMSKTELPSQKSSYGFMQERKFCLETGRPCNISFVVHIQVKANNTIETFCLGIVTSKNEVITVASCVKRILETKAKQIYILFFNGERIKVRCVKDSIVIASQSPKDFALNIYIAVLVLCKPSPACPAVINSNNFDGRAVLLSYNRDCKTTNEPIELTYTNALVIPLTTSILGLTVAAPVSPDWLLCGFGPANEGNVLVNSKCEVIGLRFVPPQAYLQLVYDGLPIASKYLINPKCSLFFSIPKTF